MRASKPGWIPRHDFTAPFASAVISYRIFISAVAVAALHQSTAPAAIAGCIWACFSWPLKTSQSIERESISLLGAALSLQGLGV